MTRRKRGGEGLVLVVDGRIPLAVRLLTFSAPPHSTVAAAVMPRGLPSSEMDILQPSRFSLLFLQFSLLARLPALFLSGSRALGVVIRRRGAPLPVTHHHGSLVF